MHGEADEQVQDVAERGSEQQVDLSQKSLIRNIQETVTYMKQSSTSCVTRGLTHNNRDAKYSVWTIIF